MLLQPVSAAEMQAARIVTGAAMVGLLGAPIFGRWAGRVRMVFGVAYIAAVLGMLVYHLVG